MKCALFLAEGFEECEAMIVIDMLRRGGIAVDSVSMANTDTVKSSHGVEIRADRMFESIQAEDYDVLILPGGKLGVINLKKSEDLKQVLKKHFEAGKLTCAICAGPSLLGQIGILKGKHYTCFPGFEEDAFEGIYETELSVRDGNLITGRGMGATIEFTLNILKTIADEKALAKVEYGIQYEHAFRTLKKPQ